MEDIQNQLLLKYQQANSFAWEQITSYWPRFQNYNPFERFIILNITIIIVFSIVNFILKFPFVSLKKKVIKTIFSLGVIRNKVNSQLQKTKKQILHQYPENLLPKIDKIPNKPVSDDLGELCQKQSLKGRLSGSRYAVENHSKFVINLAKLFSYSNPLHYDMFPMVKQMENQIIDMTADFVGLKDSNGRSCGTLNSGGTQSINMAILAYREHGIKQKGKTRPNLVICSTGHAAAIKACVFFQIQIRLVPCETVDYGMHIGKMKSQIDQNTICVYTSYPNYPYGTNDDIKTIAAYCKSRDIPVHIDMCLGGYVCPFQQQNWSLPEGITSISLDPHKYGLAAKGVSVLLYSSDQFRKNQYYVTAVWPGGIYCTPGVAGSRSGVYIASAWISLMKLGVKGLKQNAKLLNKTVVSFSEELKQMGFIVFGKPTSCIVAFKHPKYSQSSIHTFMKKKNWGLALIQHPLAFHFSFTPLNCGKKDQMVKDLKECLIELEKNPMSTKQSAQIQLYGACATIPDNNTKHEMISVVMDTFIDLC